MEEFKRPLESRPGLGRSVRQTAPTAPMSQRRVWALTLLNLAYGYTLASQGILVAPLEARRLWPGHSSVALGALAALCGLAQLIGPEAGHWSDSWRSRLGRRRPLLIMSVVLLSVFTLGLWLLSVWRLCFSYAVVFLLQQLALNVIVSTQLGLVPDLVPPEQNGFAGGASAANVLVGALGCFVVMHTFSNLDYHWTYAFIVGVTLPCCAVVCWVADEESSLDRPVETRDPTVPWLRWVTRHYHFDFWDHRGFCLMMLTKTLYYAAVMVKGFLLFFCKDTFRLPDPADENALTAKVSVSAEGTAALTALCVMLLLDGDGAKAQGKASSAGCSGVTRSLISLGLGGLWMSLLYLGPTIVGFQVQKNFPHAGAPAAAAWSTFMLTGTALWGVGQGMYLAGDQALTFELLPNQEQAARCMGFFSVCSSVGAAMGGLTAGGLLYAFGGGAGATSYAFPGYAAIFIFASGLSVTIATIASQIRVPRATLPQHVSDAYHAE